MGAYDYEIRQALREIVQEMKSLRKEIKAIRNHLTTPGGLTAATTRLAHLVVDVDKQHAYCSACGGVYGAWEDNIEFALMPNGEKCEFCGAILQGDAEFVSGSESE